MAEFVAVLWLVLLFSIPNIIYIARELICDDFTSYNAFDGIWYVSDMNLFGKIICSVFTGVFCCVGIFVLYAAKFIYWAFHYKKEG